MAPPALRSYGAPAAAVHPSMLPRAVRFALALLAAASLASAQTPVGTAVQSAVTPAVEDDLPAMLLASSEALRLGDRDRATGLLQTVAARAEAAGQPAIEGQARRRLAAAFVYLEQFPRAIDE